MTQSNPTLELHGRVLIDLDRRDSTVREKEREARRLLEQALAQCGAERAAIANERAVLSHAEQLYRRFLGVSTAVVADQPPPEPAVADVEQLKPAEAGPDAELIAEGADPGATQHDATEVESVDAASSDIQARVRDLRSGLAVQVTLEDAAGQKPTKWAGPLRALLSSGS